MKRIDYEWDIESVDEYGDIVDHGFNESCPTEPLPAGSDLVLVKSYLDPTGSFIEEKAWAYTRGTNELPEEFDDGSKVPVRFHKELRKARG